MCCGGINHRCAVTKEGAKKNHEELKINCLISTKFNADAKSCNMSLTLGDAVTKR